MVGMMDLDKKDMTGYLIGLDKEPHTDPES